MKRKLLLMALLSIVLLAACSSEDETSSVINGTEDLKQLVQDYSTDKITDGSASITSRELIITNEDNSKTLIVFQKMNFLFQSLHILKQPILVPHKLNGLPRRVGKRRI